MRWFTTGDGETPIDPEERSGLLLPAFSRGDLDALEQANVTDGLHWAYKRRKLGKELLTINGLRSLHRQMFGDVWDWAGEFRRTEKNLGVPPYDIGPELKKACDDAQYWFSSEDWRPEEAAVRYHHRLVRVHPFVNGNGRHARVVADLLLHHRGGGMLAWPTDRDEYIAALRAADNKRFQAMVQLIAPEGG